MGERRPELDFARTARCEPVLAVDAAEPFIAGPFPPGSSQRLVKFARPATGRYFAIKSLNAHHGKPCAAIAELVILDADLKPVSATGSRP